MKKMLSIVAMILSLAINSFALTASVTTTGASTNNLLSHSAAITGFVFVNSDATQVATVHLVDSYTTNLVYTNAAYTNYSISTFTSLSTNVPTALNPYLMIYTNFQGIIETNTNSFIMTVAGVSAAATNNLPVIVHLSIPAASTVTYSPALAITAWRGITITNSNVTNISTTILYTTLM